MDLVNVPFDPEECRIIADLIEAHLVEDIRHQADVGFDWMRKVLGIHEKCKRVVQDGECVDSAGPALRDGGIQRRGMDGL